MAQFALVDSPFLPTHNYLQYSREGAGKMLKLMKVLALVLFAVALALPMWMPNTVEGQGGTEALTTDMDAKTPNDLIQRLWRTWHPNR